MARILHLIPHVEEGGAQRQLSYVLSLAGKHDTEVATLIASSPERTFPYYRRPPVRLHALSYTNDFYAPEILPNLRRLLREGKYSLIHCWMFEAVIQGAIAARMEGAPCLAAPRALLDMLRLGKKKAWEKRMVRKTLSLADLVLFASRTMAADYCSAGWVDPARARVVQNGVDCGHFQPTEGSGEGLVTIGRYSPEKGFDDLALVLRELRKEFPSLECIAAGGGEHPEMEGIVFTGFMDDVRPALSRGAVYITTSQTEGMSCSLLEAQACGLPVVARNIGSNSEVVQDGVSGFLAGNTSEFADRCRTLLADRDLQKEMGRRARERMVTNFSIQQQVEKIEAIYSELL